MTASQPLPMPFPTTDDAPKLDVRPEWIGPEEAARIVGIGRTQMWRYARRWYEEAEAGHKPQVRVYVSGTANRRRYRLLRADVLRFARQRSLRNAIRPLNAMTQRLRSTLRDGLLKPEEVPALVRRSRRR